MKNNQSRSFKNKRNKSTALQKARNYAFLLLKFRLRSEKELIFRLRKKDFDDKTINEVIALLKKDGYINDTYLEDYPEEEAAKRIAKDKFDKLKGIEPLKAKRRIFSYLLRRGFSPEAINDAIERL